MVHLPLLVCAIALVSSINGQMKEDNTCFTHETCSDCIRTPNCAWCGYPNLEEPARRCRLRDNATDDWCKKDFVIDPQEEHSILEDKPLTDSKDGDGPVQLGPQRVKLRLRVGKTYELKVHYKHAQDYPVDLYYLMDLSNSMKDDKDELSNLGDKLATKMKEITTNFRMGFGSFVDKVAMPFTSTTVDKLKNPCGDPPCAPPFSFINNLPLTINTDKFKEEVKKANVSGNLDSPEGGLDALMQAIVCEQIGWRKKARRMIIFTTDAASHVAGDGKLAGIVEPNDGLCHLNEQNMYTESLNLDYPSISQINQKMRENNTHVIFAVTRKYQALYKVLSSGLELSSLRELSANSNNVVDLVVEEYKKLSDRLKLTHDHKENLEVRYFTKCLTEKEIEISECGDLKRGKQVDFNVRITVTGCRKTGKAIEKQEFHITPGGIGEKVTVELEVICGCDCNKVNMNEKNSPTCNNNGDLECGLCECYEGYLGSRCKCNSASDNPEMEETSGCKDERNVTCSGRGTCACNSCVCTPRSKNELFYGDLCECDNFSCNRHDGKLCSDNGMCRCGKCDCNSGWSGESCQCRDTMEGCRSPGDTTICNGRGHCECGRCTCNQTKDGHVYSGQYCQECPSCPGALCKDLEVCLECRQNNKSPEEAKKCAECGHVTVVDDIRAKDDDSYNSFDSTQDKICPVADGQGCTLYFRYRFMDGSHRVWIQKEKECGPNILGVVFGVVGATVLLGLLIILVWKILTTIHDKREYAKFEKERAESKWDRGGNPLYQPSTSTFTNPTFNKS